MPSAAERVREVLRQKKTQGAGQGVRTQKYSPELPRETSPEDEARLIQSERAKVVLRSSKVKEELQRLQGEIPFDTNLDDEGYVMSLEWEIEGVFRRMTGGINFQLPIHDRVTRGISIRGVAIGSNIMWLSFYPVGQFPYPELVSTVDGIRLIANEDFLVINAFEKQPQNAVTIQSPKKHMEPMDPSIWSSRLHSRDQLYQLIARHTLRALEISS